MKDSTKQDSKNNALPKLTLSTALAALKSFLRLWSLQTLSNFPARLKNLWQRLLGSYWFIPTASVFVGILLAPLLLTIDQYFNRDAIKEIGFVFTGDDSAARSVMTTIAGAVIGVAGTTFSITIAVLSMASSQFGPRLLRNFLTDTPNQFVLGAFIGTFSYSLLVLKSIHKQDVMFGVPQLSVTFAIIMAVTCALLLVYFIQHMVHAIQASHVIQGARNEAIKNIRYWYRDHCSIQQHHDVIHHGVEQLQACHNWQAIPIYAPAAGYLQQIYVTSLVTLATDYGGVIQLHSNLGDFVTDKNIIGHFYQCPAEHPSYLQKTDTPNLAMLPRTPDSLFWERFAASLYFESMSASSNDIAYSLGQMTEIAVRALSPGTNDPKTAVNCIQSLTTCLSIMMQRQPPSPYHFYIPTDIEDNALNENNTKNSKSADTAALKPPRVAILAVITKTPKISDFIDTSLGEIRRYATADLMVLKALCQAITDLNYARINSAQRQVLLHELTLIERAGQTSFAYSELAADLTAMCLQARQFIHDDSAQHQYFEYISDFDAHIHKELETQAS